VCVSERHAQTDKYSLFKKRLNSLNDCYRSIQNALLSLVLSEHLKIKTYKTVILLVALYGRET
jgi:hypothetical protein